MPSINKFCDLEMTAKNTYVRPAYDTEGKIRALYNLFNGNTAYVLIFLPFSAVTIYSGSLTVDSLMEYSMDSSSIFLEVIKEDELTEEDKKDD